jgi:hypothetical protein
MPVDDQCSQEEKAAAGATRSQKGDKIFEIKNASDDEVYYTVGMVASLKDAKEFLLNEDDLPINYIEFDASYGDAFCRFEVFEHEIGNFSVDPGKIIYVVEFAGIYPDDDDEYKWSRKEITEDFYGRNRK